MGAFEGERAVVVGLGVAGRALAIALAEEGAEVLVTESRPGTVGDVELQRLGVRILSGGHEPDHLEGATFVSPSPGVPERSPILAWARERGLPILGELEIGARLARVPLLGVTGTNGKTTTVGMLASILRAAGLDAVACGNIGYPFPTAAREEHDALVVEASSFQLRTQESFRPRVSALLNLAADHLDWHGSLEGYREAKAAIFAHQGPEDWHVGNHDDAAAAALSAVAPCRLAWFTLGAPDEDETGWVEGRLVGPWGALPADTAARFDTRAVRADAAAAAACASAFGLAADAIAEGLAAFEPARHRGETVATARGVRFVDNSKATNPHAALAAAEDGDGLVLIAGGDAKGVDLSPLASLAPRLAGVVAIGTAADEVVGLFEGRLPTRKAGSIEEAARTAFELAPADGTVLLAPACASWDMFRDYEERGDRFAAAARDLEREETAS